MVLKTYAVILSIKLSFVTKNNLDFNSKHEWSM